MQGRREGVVKSRFGKNGCKGIVKSITLIFLFCMLWPAIARSDIINDINRYIDLYKRSTPAEKKLARYHPEKMRRASRLNLPSEKLCERIYGINGRNDESDACRHFVRAALLYKKFGRGFSKLVLDAHEAMPDKPFEKAMDLHNNEVGLNAAERLSKRGQLNRKQILCSFLKHLQQNRLRVIRPETRIIRTVRCDFAPH